MKRHRHVCVGLQSFKRLQLPENQNFIRSEYLSILHNAVSTGCYDTPYAWIINAMQCIINLSFCYIFSFFVPVLSYWQINLSIYLSVPFVRHVVTKVSFTAVIGDRWRLLDCQRSTYESQLLTQRMFWPIDGWETTMLS